jgi:uncharacterized protein YbjT (DUF2867 family)
VRDRSSIAGPRSQAQQESFGAAQEQSPGAPRRSELEEGGLELHEGDVLRPESLRGAGHGVDVAYYLIHSMGRGATGDFVASERAAATAFAQMASSTRADWATVAAQSTCAAATRPHSRWPGTVRR